MKKIIVLFSVLFVCFGFSEKEKLEIETNCCQGIKTGCITPKKIPPGYEFYKKIVHRVIEGQVSLLLQLDTKRGISYILNYELYNSNEYLKNTVELFVLNQENDTLVRTFLNGKHYDGITYKSEKDQLLRVYIDPQENPLLLKKHKKKDKCATVRCIEYVIGTRMVEKE